ncbi:ribosome recycling factor [Candidatus Saccharibacteria bacterium]|nr:ribosome recycling factor [Candidatus Saccharibacteria bacterium]
MVRQIIDGADPKMQKAIEHLDSEMTSLRTGRASTSLVDSLIVEVYGVPQPLKAIASINTPDSRSIAITPWDRTSLPIIEKAIRENQQLGLNPNNDGTVIRLNIPSMTEDRRREVVKSLGAKVEDCRIALRNIRHDTLGEVKKLEKAKEATQDDVKFAETELNKKIETFQRKIEELEAAKTKEIMSV